MTDEITADQVIDWLIENRAGAESILEQTLIAKGWTPPAEKEPKFKEGEPVEVSAEPTTTSHRSPEYRNS